MKGKLHYYTLEILFVLLIIFVGTKIQFVFHPVGVFATTLFFPILISGFLFFILNPIVQLLVKRKVPKSIAIMAIYLFGIGLLVLIGASIGPVIVKQITELAKSTPHFVSEMRKLLLELSHSETYNWLLSQDIINIDDIEKKLVNFSEALTDGLWDSVKGIFSIFANVTLIILTLPFILFYMLKDGHRLEAGILRFMPTDLKGEISKILKETTLTLGDYIQGQMIVCLFIATATTIGYMIIGLKYALIFGLMIGVLNLIPYVGAWIGTVPALIIGYLDSPIKALLVIVVILIVQQLDANIISPLVIGNRLDVHPLTIMLLLLVAGNLAGILGMVLAVPTYAVTRTIAKNSYRIWKLRRI